MYLSSKLHIGAFINSANIQMLKMYKILRAQMHFVIVSRKWKIK